MLSFFFILLLIFNFTDRRWGEVRLRSRGLRIYETNMNATFTKRKNGIFKKANELHVLCEVDVATIIFSGSGRIHFECKTRNEEAGLTGILQQISTSSETVLWDSTHENLIAQIEYLKKENERNQIELRHLKGDDHLQPLEISHLQALEHALDEGYFKAREKPEERKDRMIKNENDLMENLQLRDYLHKQELLKQKWL